MSYNVGEKEEVTVARVAGDPGPAPVRLHQRKGEWPLLYSCARQVHAAGGATVVGQVLRARGEVGRAGRSGLERRTRLLLLGGNIGHVRRRRGLFPFDSARGLFERLVHA